MTGIGQCQPRGVRATGVDIVPKPPKERIDPHLVDVMCSRNPGLVVNYVDARTVDRNQI